MKMAETMKYAGMKYKAKASFQSLRTKKTIKSKRVPIINQKVAKVYFYSLSSQATCYVMKAINIEQLTQDPIPQINSPTALIYVDQTYSIIRLIEVRISEMPISNRFPRHQIKMTPTNRPMVVPIKNISCMAIRSPVLSQCMSAFQLAKDLIRGRGRYLLLQLSGREQTIWVQSPSQFGHMYPYWQNMKGTTKNVDELKKLITQMILNRLI